jgi:hypothetical protein
LNEPAPLDPEPLEDAIPPLDDPLLLSPPPPFGVPDGSRLLDGWPPHAGTPLAESTPKERTTMDGARERIERFIP